MSIVQHIPQPTGRLNMVPIQGYLLKRPLLDEHIVPKSPMMSDGGQTSRLLPKCLDCTAQSPWTEKSTSNYDNWHNSGFLATLGHCDHKTVHK